MAAPVGPAAPRRSWLPSAGATLAGATALTVLGILGLGVWLWLAGPPVDPTRAAVLLPPPGAKSVADAAPGPGTPSPGTPAAVAHDAGPPAFTGAEALPPAPDPGLIEHADAGYLPAIGRDGRMPWKVYARPFDLSDKRPRVAIVIGWLGISGVETDAAINHLPPGVTLAILPYAKRLGDWVAQARNAGHEVLLDLPLQPTDYPRQDPGPQALLTALDSSQNLERLHWMMAQTNGYVGFIGLMGSQFSTFREDFQPILAEIGNRGLLYVDNRASPQTSVPAIALDIKLPIASMNRLIDADPTRPSIDRKLSELEDIARRNGVALGLGRSDPVTLERVSVWAEDLAKRGIVLAPVSAIVGPPKTEIEPVPVSLAPPPPPPDEKDKKKEGEGEKKSH